MQSVLIVEDSIFFGVLLKNKLEKETNFKGRWCRSMSEAVKTLEQADNHFFAAILDYNLPDAPDGEIIDAVIKRGVPAIVFTGIISEKVRSLVWSKKVVDYALKDDSQSINYILTMLKRLKKNINTKVMVVEDSLFFKKVLKDLLEIHNYTVFIANNGKEGLEVLEKNPDIKMVITDYHMPLMDGFTLTQKIREKYSKDRLAIIGISAEGDNVMGARFIKSGANDFIIKQTFLTEEFYCRVTQNIETLEYIQMVREAAIKDFLTGLYNRRYFFDMGKKLFASAKRESLSILCCMIDIDFFKKVNDTYGHDAGDIVLQEVSSILKNRMRETDIVARIGGEEFCILAVNMDQNEAEKIFDDLRKKIEQNNFNIGDKQIKVTISLGLSIDYGNSLDEMVSRADTFLFQAKKQGRNKVVFG